MKTALEFLKEHIEETNIPKEHYELEIAGMMDWYADYYHESKVKNLTIPRVSQQRELLLAFVEYYNNQEPYEYVPISVIERFLKANNCG